MTDNEVSKLAQQIATLGYEPAELPTIFDRIECELCRLILRHSGTHLDDKGNNGPVEVGHSKGYATVELDQQRQRVQLRTDTVTGYFHGRYTTWLTGDEAFDLGKALIDTGAQCEHVTDDNSNPDTPEAGP